MSTRFPSLVGLVVSLALAAGCTSTGGGGRYFVTDGGNADRGTDTTNNPDLAGGCPSGLTACGGTCTDPSFDPHNCGSCGHACATGQACLEGTCQTSGCSGGLTMCNSECTDLSSDPSNCGVCNKVCSGGQSCSSGRCVCDFGTLCSGTCTDTSSNVNNCGACGKRCTTGQSCSGGVCTGGQPTMTGCNGFLVCTNNCAQGDSTCINDCYNNTTSTGKSLYIALYCCVVGNGPTESVCTTGSPACSHGTNGICDSSSASYNSASCDSCIDASQMSGGACYSKLQACGNNTP